MEDGGRPQLSRSSNLRGDESSGGRDLASRLKGRGKTRKRAKRAKREGREETVRHLKAAVWAAEKLEAPRSHLDRAGRQESVGNNRGGRAVGWVKSDEPVAKNRKKNLPLWKPGRKQRCLIDNAFNRQRN